MRNYNYNPRTNGEITQKKQAILINQVSTILLAICLLFCATAFITSKTYYTAEVEGASMYPTINAYQKTTSTNDIAYYTIYKKPVKGDMIIVDYQGIGSNIDAIKRLIAVGGDTICYYNNSIYLNGVALSEPYLQKDYELLKNDANALYNSGYASADDWKNSGYEKSKNNFERWCEILLDESLTEQQIDALLTDTTFFKNYNTSYQNSVQYSETLSTYVLTVPDGFVYFLGDNRANSSDCSLFGPLEQKYMLAKVDFVTSGTATVYSNFWKEIKYLFA